MERRAGIFERSIALSIFTMLLSIVTTWIKDQAPTDVLMLFFENNPSNNLLPFTIEVPHWFIILWPLIIYPLQIRWLEKDTLPTIERFRQNTRSFHLYLEQHQNNILLEIIGIWTLGFLLLSLSITLEMQLLSIFIVFNITRLKHPAYLRLTASNLSFLAFGAGCAKGLWVMCTMLLLSLGTIALLIVMKKYWTTKNIS